MSDYITVGDEKFERIRYDNDSKLHVGARVAVQIAETAQHYVVTIESETPRQWRMSNGERFSKWTRQRIRSAKNADRYSMRFIIGLRITDEQIAEREAERERHRRLLKSATGHRLMQL